MSEGTPYPSAFSTVGRFESVTVRQIPSRTRPPSRAGCSATRRRRGSAFVRRSRRRGRIFAETRHGSAQHALTLANLAQPVTVETSLALALGGDAHLGVPVWSGAQKWARITVPAAYDTHYARLVATEELRHDRVSRRTLIAVADARASFADRHGRHCRPTNAVLAQRCGITERHVRRAGRLLIALGCATEILRGRQRTKDERLASWAIGDRSRGWASVWALHPPRPAVDNSRDEHGVWRPVSFKKSTHPRRGSLSVDSLAFRNNSPTGAAGNNASRAGHGPPINGSAPRSHRIGKSGKKYGAPDPKGVVLASRWLADGRTPAWAARHTARGWARILAAPAAHDWTPQDINMALREFVTVSGRYMPDRPHRPIGLVGAAIAAVGVENPPAALERAREAAAAEAARAERLRERAEIAAALANRAAPETRDAAKEVLAQRLRQNRERRRGQ